MTTFQQKHGRPKPPKIWGGLGRLQYEIARPHVLTIFKARKSSLWAVSSKGYEIHAFDTRAEAITWAQKHAHNRNESGGEVSGA
ncbi:DUF2188 domain-containing protein [Jonesia denitrificans]|uniref:Uncharacterized protein n=1 Tax=Jonesia denitrificans (strain ATCC 14870 / DSM 20603 / BCRC 15368 / CIP 55.134 / JCM 11481 / NBRC 15587 / NCTC 10816 / Prevot 55134) TaxID=471856 RepID=C7R1F4_JONDD|nr:DUF2188 domain-containing protein [Jonesia denitrificans]ACV09789.1 hypothetical protein Jden_2152 [Jonesia denitrificans DSM 20603]ACV09927.1 hypothetical protein Jden_2292 [Jonesia denitrificans DSM 20603]ASE08832.1 DUF2188 domain-containing protein [Jonesia denitrificans]ASE08889.1 DUF2188 domain-containing protein [Jonesia denitrificans]ASE09010.1 DUF2188 domain-containing protein [Jonesia denitrificans]